MTAVTTYAKGKPFTWSYSRLKNYAVCPKRHWHIDIVKNVKEQESEQLIWGNEVHEKLALRLGPKKASLPVGMRQYEPVAAGVENMPGKLYVEQKYGLTEEFAPCGFFDSKVWYRGVGDVVVVQAPRALAVDWKLGKVIADSQQLALMAACIFGHYPEVEQVDTAFMWLKEDARTHEVFKREDMVGMWNALMPRIQEYKHAIDHDIFPAKPGPFCRRWCPVDVCPHYGGE